MFPYAWALPEDGTLQRAASGEVSFVHGHTQAAFGNLPSEIETAISSLTTRPRAQEDLIAEIVESAPDQVPVLLMTLSRLSDCGLLRPVLCHGDDAFATLVPVRPDFVFRHAAVDDVPWELDRFAALTPADDGMHLHAPGAPAKILLRHRHGAAVVHALASARSPGDLVERVPELDGELIARLLSLMCAAGLAVSHDELAQTQPHWQRADLWFHTHSRRGYAQRPLGNLFSGATARSPGPVVKPAMSDNWIDLPRADLNAARSTDEPFAEVLERRQSHRALGSTLLSIEDLGAFLYRCARVRAVVDDRAYVASSRPTPSGGACHELEIYAAITQCAGVDPGLYHFAPDNHRLYRLPDEAETHKGLLLDAQTSSGAPAPPPVLFILSARFGRVMWKYDGIAYALVLKHVGVMMQTMYLTATAMGLGGCALGGGDSVRFAEATGLDWRQESSVGEFMLGRLPEEA
ncbi:MAG: SagB family peptide dehydrogenase [Pseudomonadota bacterium]